MSDVAVKRVDDLEYRVYGLQGLADTISEASSRMSELISTRLEAAEAALEGWRGPHATTFVGWVDDVLEAMVTLKLAIRDAGHRCDAFPDESDIGYADQMAYSSARVDAPYDLEESAGAVTSTLRDYVTVAREQDRELAGLAATVSVDHLSAEVAARLTPSELEEAGHPDSVLETEVVFRDYEPASVTEVFDLPDLSDDATTLGTNSADLAIWVEGVADAIDEADSQMLELLLEHPTIAGFVDDDPDTEGRMNGEAALAVALQEFELFSRAGEGIGAVTLSKLEIVADGAGYPEHVRAAAQYLLDNRLLVSQLSLTSGDQAFEGEPDAVHFTQHDIARFQRFNEALRTIAMDFEQLDTADQDADDADGHVSVEDLEYVAEEGSPYPEDLRAAAQLLLEDGQLSQRIAAYQHANGYRAPSGLYYDHLPEPLFGSEPGTGLGDDPTGFDYEGIVALAVDQQAFTGDPEAAHQFVTSLPVAQADGTSGLSVHLTTDEGVQALANVALSDTDSLVEQVDIVSHLPETVAWDGPQGAVAQDGGVRNTLITGMYDLLATRADELFAGPELAGRPFESGHPGASWAQFGVWASNGVQNVITGELELLPGVVVPAEARQSAADGNQWIFNDLAPRFAAFLEMYKANPQPTEGEIERFFLDTFEDGDGTVRNAFAAYVAAMDETDPAERQRLMYQGNLFVGMHEQAGVQPFIEAFTEVGHHLYPVDDLLNVPAGTTDWLLPDDLVDAAATSWYIEMQVGRERLHMGDDVPGRSGLNNLVMPEEFLSLDPAGLTPEDFGIAGLPDLAGIEAFQPDFSQSLHGIWERGSTNSYTAPTGIALPNPLNWDPPVPDPVDPFERSITVTTGESDDPESTTASAATEWSDWGQRMNYIARYFEQFHTDRELYRTDGYIADLGDLDWLDDEVRPGG